MLRVTTLSLAFILAAPALAQAAQPPGAQPQAAPVKEKKVCKTEEISTGSIMPKRVCKTADEWAATKAANSNVPDQLRQYQQNQRNVTGNR